MFGAAATRPDLMRVDDPRLCYATNLAEPSVPQRPLQRAVPLAVLACVVLGLGLCGAAGQWQRWEGRHYGVAAGRFAAPMVLKSPDVRSMHRPTERDARPASALASGGPETEERLPDGTYLFR
eukprot:EG_transcript_51347